MNLCKDCKHFALRGNATMCTATAISLIDGESRPSEDHCAKARGRNGRCGLDGRLYEAIEVVQVEQEAPKQRKPRAKPPVTQEAKDGDEAKE